MRRVLAGESAAAAALFDRHLPLLRAAARRRLPGVIRPRVAVSDVIQEAWTAAFVRLPEFHDQGEGSFGRWLRTILEHKVVDEVRRHVEGGKRDARRDVRMAADQEPRANRRRVQSPMSEVAAAEEAATVRRAVARLPSDDRTVLRYLQEEGLTASEAGERMGRSGEAVRKLYARALGRLADELDDPGAARS